MGFRGRGTVLIGTAAPTQSIDVGDPFVTGGSGLAADAGHQHQFSAAALAAALAPGGLADLSPSFVNLAGAQTVDGAKVFNGTQIFSGTLKVEAGAITTELPGQHRILAGNPAAYQTAPNSGLGIQLYNDFASAGSSDIYTGITSRHYGGPNGINKTWGISSAVYNQSPFALSTVGLYASVRNSGGTPTWAAAFEVWDSFDAGAGLVQSNANMVCLELLNLHDGTGTSHGLTVIGGHTVPGTRGIWVQPGTGVNGAAGWSTGIEVQIGPIDVNSVGILLNKAPTGFPSGTAWRYLKGLNNAAGEVFAFDTTGALNITNWSAGTNAGLLKFLRSGTVTAQTGIDASDRWTVFTTAGAALVTADGTIAAGETALWVRSAGALVRVKAGAAGTGPGGSGQALYI